jgi:hypothetical protein
VKRSSSTTLALASHPRVAAAEGDLGALRRRVTGLTTREAVLADLLEDDLREAQGALSDVAAWLAGADRALSDPRCGKGDLLALAGGDGPLERLAYLETTVCWLRRRLGQLAVRLPREV